MVVGDDEFHTTKAPLDEAVEEVAPMDFGLGKSDRHAQHAPLAVGGDADRDQDGAVDHAAGFADPFVAGIEEDIGGFAQRAFPPGGEGFVELLGYAADLCGGYGHFRAEQGLQDGDDFAG
jgi:hypothetical protein